MHLEMQLLGYLSGVFLSFYQSLVERGRDASLPAAGMWVTKQVHPQIKKYFV